MVVSIPDQARLSAIWLLGAGVLKGEWEQSGLEAEAGASRGLCRGEKRE